MKPKKLASLLILLTLLSCGSSNSQEMQKADTEAKYQLTILYTADAVGYLDPCG